LVEDIIALALSLFVLVYIIKREKRPAIVILEAFCFVFLYASIYENAACVMGLYSYGRIISDDRLRAASVPLIEVCGHDHWTVVSRKNFITKVAWPPIVGLFGMLQIFHSIHWQFVRFFIWPGWIQVAGTG